MEISARNQLKARVSSIKVGDVMAEVVLEIGGQEIVSVITRASAEHLRIAVGRRGCRDREVDRGHAWEVSGVAGFTASRPLKPSVPRSAS
jgi:molybdopterin-binding protein